MSNQTSNPFLHHLRFNDEEMDFFLKSLLLSKQHLNPEDQQKLSLFLTQNEWRYQRQEKIQSNDSLMNTLADLKNSIEKSFEALPFSLSFFKNPLKIRALLDDLGVIEKDLIFINAALGRRKTIDSKLSNAKKRQEICEFIDQFTMEHYFSRTHAFQDHASKTFSGKYEKQVDILIDYLQEVPKPSKIFNFIIFAIDAHMKEKPSLCRYEDIADTKAHPAINEKHLSAFKRGRYFFALPHDIRQMLYDTQKIAFDEYIHPNAKREQETGIIQRAKIRRR